MSSKKIYFYLPVHNEEQIIAKSTDKLLNFCQDQEYDFVWKIIIVVNGSSDKTLDISNDLQAKYTDMIEIKNYSEPGRGLALRKAFLDSEADIALYMDIDLAASLKNISDLIKPLLQDECDLAIGSRLMPVSKIERSFIRELSSQGYNILSRLMLKHNFSDMQCGFKAIKVDVFRQIEPFLIDQKWFFDTELIAWTKKLGYRVVEVPVDWSENRYDRRKSKVRMVRDSMRFFVNLIRLRGRIKVL